MHSSSARCPEQQQYGTLRHNTSLNRRRGMTLTDLVDAGFVGISSKRAPSRKVYRDRRLHLSDAGRYNPAGSPAAAPTEPPIKMGNTPIANTSAQDALLCPRPCTRRPFRRTSDVTAVAARVLRFELELFTRRAQPNLEPEGPGTSW